eukprot:c2676_g1_i1.p1 GENE.c2676_g1_i1~~c2676_g1_i1.p1  ORF type:complete len:297 (+),score=96.12 c2676_g1_i1:50-892(+)
MSFVEKLDDEALAFFNHAANQSFGNQCVAFLNAYWNEVHTQAEFIFTVAWETMKYADMHTKGISLIHQYEEGNDVDFDVGLYFYEQLCKFVEDPANARWASAEFGPSQPVMMTAIQRKKELREKVDVNFDGRVSMLEYLLYQYQDVANPADFVKRSLTTEAEHPEITKARQALEDVNKRIRDYEAEKSRLEELAAGTGVKALGAKNMLAQLDNSPLKEDLNRALITAEAAVRIATRNFGGAGHATTGRESVSADFSSGALWWLNRDLEEKQKKYGRKAKN